MGCRTRASSLGWGGKGSFVPLVISYFPSSGWAFRAYSFQSPIIFLELPKSVETIAKIWICLAEGRLVEMKYEFDY